MDDLLNDFIAETRETLDAIGGEIVAWEAAPQDRARLDAIFRFVHTVKGSCGFLDLPRLEKLSHAAEDVLAEVRAERRQPDRVLVSAVLCVIDRIGELVDAIETGEPLPDDEDSRLIAALAVGAGEIAREPGAEPVGAPAPRALARSIRLPIELLDRMMGSVSDLVLARNELSRKLRDHAGSEDTAVETAFDRLSACIAEMREAITRTRMQRIDNLFAALPRVVRDLSADLGKLVALQIDGGDVELDREMIEMIRDPLTHIVRNAIDHGIEPPAERRAAGKSAAGSLRVSARQAGNQILIDIADDGRGIDAERLVQKAVAAGILEAAQADALSWAAKLALVFEPGLSTAKAVTAVSGRGVGMDVVRANVERIGGLVDIDSRPQQGLRLTLRVPLTLTIIPALTVCAGEQRFAVPRSAIEEIVRVGRGGVRIDRVGGAAIACIRERRLPVVELDRLIGVRAVAGAEPILIVLKPAGGSSYALAVDGVLDHEELVVKPAAPAVMASGIYAGTTLPDNGQPMLLLDAAGVAAVAGVLAEGPAASDGVEEAQAAVAAESLVPTLLFRDLDGIERGVRLSVVERIEDVDAAQIAVTAGRLRLAHDGELLLLHRRGDGHGEAGLRVLRLGDGVVHVAYAIAEVIDIVPIGAAIDPAAAHGAIAGVTLVEGRPVELLDPFWLFADVSGGAADAVRKPLALLCDGDDGWMREVLAPLVRAAGFRVAFLGEGGAQAADVVIAGEGATVTQGGAPVVRLRIAPTADPSANDSLYRYDRPGLLAQLEACAGRG